MRREGVFLGYLKSEAGAAYDATLFGPRGRSHWKGSGSALPDEYIVLYAQLQQAQRLVLYPTPAFSGSIRSYPSSTTTLVCPLIYPLVLWTSRQLWFLQPRFLHHSAVHALIE